MFFRSFRVVMSSLFALSFASVAFAKGSKSDYVEIPADQVKWFDVPGTPLKMAVLWGNPEKGPHGRLLKLPAGFEAGMHSHTNSYHSILMSGTWLHWEEGASSPKELTAGSYVMQPGKKNHNDKCKEGADCIVFTYQEGKNDYFPAKAAK